MTLDQVVNSWKQFLQQQDEQKLQQNSDQKTQQLTWNSVKSNAERTKDNTFLLAYGAIRKQVVDSLLSVALVKAEQQLSGVHCKDCYALSAGSQNPTSDYDVTVFGTLSAFVVQHFYALFREAFVAEPGKMFDSNVYGGPSVFYIWRHDFFEKIDDSRLEKQVYNRLKSSSSSDGDGVLRTFAIEKALLTTLQPLSNERDGDEETFCTPQKTTKCAPNPTGLCASERCWALLSFMRFLNADQERTLALKTFARYAPRAATDLQNYAALERQLAEERASFDRLPLNRTCVQPTMLMMCHQTNYYLSLIERSQRAQTELYEKIVAAQSTARELTTAKAVLRHKITHAALYGVEMYATMGAVLHVVVQRQMQIDVPDLLRPDDRYGSFLENCGYAYHVFVDTRPRDRFVDAPFCIAALLKGSKYLARALQALLMHREANNSPNIESLSVAYRAAEEARLQARPYLDTIQPQYATQLFASIVQNAEILDLDKTCDKEKLLNAFLVWVAQQTNTFYAEE